MERVLKKRRLETAEEMEDLRQPAGAAANSSDAASSRLPKHDEISLQVKVRQYCENYTAPGFTWGLEIQTALYLCVLFVGRS